MIRAMKQRGSVNPLLISTVIFAVLMIAFAGLFVWAYMNYQDWQKNVQPKIDAAVKTAKAEQEKADTAHFKEEYKKPYLTYQGPSDLGSVSFQYPKTWSVYEDSNSGDNGGLMTYFNPKTVPPVNADGQTFALQVKVDNTSYSDTLNNLQGQVQDGTVKARPYKTNGYEGMRFTGQIDPQHKGVVVVFKIRDNTLTITANSEKYVPELDKVILKTLKFNP